MSAATTLMTADELLDRAHELGRCELVRGELIQMAPASAGHGGVAMEMGIRIGIHVKQHKLGKTYAAETGFLIGRDPDTVRAPDVAFVRNDRLHLAGERGFFNGPPDLAVGVMSPDDRAGDVLAKVRQWLDAGCRGVWVVDPQSRTVTTYHANRHAQVLTPGDTLPGGDPLPGFELSVTDIFK